MACPRSRSWEPSTGQDSELGPSLGVPYMRPFETEAALTNPPHLKSRGEKGIFFSILILVTEKGSVGLRHVVAFEMTFLVKRKSF